MEIWTTGTSRVDTAQLRRVAHLLRWLLPRLLAAQGASVSVRATLEAETYLLGASVAACLGEAYKVSAGTAQMVGRIESFACKLEAAASRYEQAEARNRSRAHKNLLGVALFGLLDGVPAPLGGIVLTGVGLLPVFGVTKPLGIEGELAARGMNKTSQWLFPTSTLVGSLSGKSPAQAAAAPAAVLAALSANPAGFPRRIRLVGPDGRVSYVRASDPLAQLKASRLQSLAMGVDVLQSPRAIEGAFALLVGANALEARNRGQTINKMYGHTAPKLSPTCAVRVAGGPPAAATALTASALAGRLGQVKSCAPADPGAHVEVLRHVNTAGKVSWTVNIRGMETFASGGKNTLGMQTNLQAVAGMRADQEIAVEKALELVGHSQGSAVATSLAADPVFTRKYNVKSVLAIAGPTRPATARKAAENGVDVLFVRDTSDAVPGLDGNAVDPQLPSLVADTTDNPARVPHSMENYQRILAEAEKRHVPYLQSWNARRNSALGLDRGATTKAYEFFAERVGPNR